MGATKQAESVAMGSERRRGIDVATDGVLTRGFLAAAEGLSRYHRHRVLHMERLGKALAGDRPVILVGNHALSLVDPLLFLTAVLKQFGVVPRSVAHEAGWFRTPILRDISAKYGVIPSRSVLGASEALARERFLFLFPGGASEAALRDYQAEPYTLKWEKRTGFVKLALEHDAEILFVAAVGNDEAYYQSRLQIPRAVMRYFDSSGGDRYAGARMPFGLGGPAALPLPVQITHVVSEPLDLGNRAARNRAKKSDEALRALHGRVWSECQEFLDAAVAEQRHAADPTDRFTRRVEDVLHLLGL